MRELSVIGVRVELPTNQPIVLLREVDGDRYLPIWIGAVEATAIAYEQQGVKPARPLTHDLLRDLLEALKAPLQAVEIVELRDKSAMGPVKYFLSGANLNPDVKQRAEWAVRQLQ